MKISVYLLFLGVSLLFVRVATEIFFQNMLSRDWSPSVLIGRQVILIGPTEEVILESEPKRGRWPTREQRLRRGRSRAGQLASIGGPWNLLEPETEF